MIEGQNHSSNLNSMAYCLNDTVENTCALNFEWSPMKKALIYDTGSNRSTPRKAQMLCNTSD